jgi:hypothetical protein
MAFTDFGIENLIDLIKMHKEDPTLLKRATAKISRTAAYAGCLRTSWRFDECLVSGVLDAPSI